MAFYFYVIQSQLDGSFYKGQTGELEDRMKRHNGGRSSFTRQKRPWKLVYTEEFKTRSEAAKREAYFKSSSDWRDWQELTKEIRTRLANSERGAAR
jgi:putative endonuclease